MAQSKPFQRFLVPLCFILLATLTGCSDGTSTPPDVEIVVFSDIHFNPFSDPSLFDDLVNTSETGWQEIFESTTASDPQTWGRESGYPLMREAIENACLHAGEAPFVVYGGDILTHHFDTLFYQLYGTEDEEAMRAFTRKTVNFFIRLVRGECGSVPVLLTLGNNDSYAGDYRIEPNGAFLKDTADIVYSMLLLNAADRERFDETWKAGGYYKTESIARDLSIISLNTVFFSRQAPEETREQAWEQLDWLEEGVAESASQGRKIWLLLHIPPGIDIFSTAAHCVDASGAFTDAVLMWREDFLAAFLDIVNGYPGTVSVMISGHTHMDEYRLVPEGEEGGAIPVVIAPAVSPLFGNNPAYKVLTVTRREWKPMDYASIYAPLDTEDQRFRLFYSSFLGMYGQSGPLIEAMAGLYSELDTDPSAQSAYTGNYYSGHDASNPINDLKWPAYRCGIASMSKDTFFSCANGR